ncbi:MAG: ATP-binding protein [Oscillospiraceae bacterium]|nr:ATP-binding protein [Oscillospiraceae bacterium]
MIEFIVGSKGSGKTKTLVDMINKAADETKGYIVCIEKNMKLIYELKHTVRLIDVDEYNINGYEQFYGFVAGILAGNYDITELYIDGILRIGARNINGFEEFIEKLMALCGDIRVVMTVSERAEGLPASLRQYQIGQRE